MRWVVCFVGLFAWVVVFPQSPGGVSEYLTWVKPGTVLKNEYTVINHNSVGMLDETHKTVLLSGDKSLLSDITFFCVSKSDTVTERALWTIGTGHGANVVLTNRRMAGLKDYKYINFENKLSDTPQILTYCRKLSLTDTVNAESLVQIGTFANSKIPAGDFKGVLPEYVLYNRVLTFQERIRVESYLAIKYGVSLNQAYPTSYLSSAGKVIWDAGMFGAFSGSIAGIGRDDTSGLLQPKSGSSNTPQMLEIEVAGLADQEFLIWGDNQGALTFLRKRGEITKLQRGWMAVASGAISEKNSTLSFSTSWLQEMYPLADGEIYWLAIDDSGKGTYNVGQSRFIASDSRSLTNLRFGNIKWDMDGNGYDYFTLVAAPELFANIQTELPNCKNKRLGSVAVELVGGVGPFQVQLLNNGAMVASYKGEQRLSSFGGLVQGSYRLLIKDGQNRTFKQEFLLANSDMESIADFDPVILKNGSSVVLDGAVGLESASGYFFNWHTPRGESFSGQYLTVGDAGVYLLKVTNNEGCSTLREADVSILPDKFLKYVEISPNPTIQKNATLKVQLQVLNPVVVSITSSSGQMISRERFSGSNYYSIKCRFPENGIWFVTVESNGEMRTLKVLADSD